LPITDDNIDDEDVAFDDSMHLPQNVIAIDDDSFQLEVIKDMLERNSVTCTVCTRVDKLTEELRKRNYDLLLTDIQMPDANGFELLKLLRRSRIGNSRDIPVVAMTARSDSERNTLLEAGFDGCIFKPFSMNELLKYIATVIKRRKLEHKTDFSKILADVTDRRHILESMIRTCEKDMAELRNAMMSNDIESMRCTAHRMFPMWEMLSMESVLSEYRNILNPGSDIRTITTNTNLIIDHIERLMDDAENEINRIADEEKDTDSRG
jgi:DNA-binding response OmpR family regulator